MVWRPSHYPTYWHAMPNINTDVSDDSQVALDSFHRGFDLLWQKMRRYDTELGLVNTSQDVVESFQRALDLLAQTLSRHGREIECFRETTTGFLASPLSKHDSFQERDQEGGTEDIEFARMRTSFRNTSTWQLEDLVDKVAELDKVWVKRHMGAKAALAWTVELLVTRIRIAELRCEDRCCELIQALRSRWHSTEMVPHIFKDHHDDSHHRLKEDLHNLTKAMKKSVADEGAHSGLISGLADNGEGSSFMYFRKNYAMGSQETPKSTENSAPRARKSTSRTKSLGNLASSALGLARA